MDIQTLFNWGLATGFSVMGWFARQLWDAVKELKKDLSTLREELAKDYVPKNDFKDFTSEIRNMFQRISDKLDDKADK
jgi:hypothetical protein